MRALAAVAMAVGAALAPIPWELRTGLGALGVYLAFTALAGSCLGYRLMAGRPAPSRPAQPTDPPASPVFAVSQARKLLGASTD